jgi:hypothetical protein
MFLKNILSMVSLWPYVRNQCKWILNIASGLSGPKLLYFSENKSVGSLIAYIPNLSGLLITYMLIPISEFK